jgi:predicted SnoaL-like aldol condensation-catalyzing enzyme
MKDLLEAGHWEMAPQFLTERYIQHNPNVASGRDTVVRFFASIGARPKPIRPNSPPRW